MSKNSAARLVKLLHFLLVLALSLSATPVVTIRSATLASPMIESVAAETQTESGPGIESRLLRQGVLSVAVASTNRDSLLIDIDSDGKADPGDTLRYTVAISNSGATDAAAVSFSDTLDANSMLSGTASMSALAIDDTYSATGNVSITVSAGSGLLSNDYGTPTPAAVPFAGTSTNGGNVVVSSAGSFTYDPPAGFEGADSFIYTAANATGASTATVTINVLGMIWFVNNNPSACTSTCDGRLSYPLTTLSAFNSLNDGAGSHPAANDNVFIYESSTNYGGPVTLLNGQKLIGQDSLSGLTVLTGLTPPAYSAALPSMNSGNGTIVDITSSSNDVNLAQNNSLYGFTAGNATATAISGSSFLTLTLDTVAISTTGVALNLSSGTANTTFTSISSNGGTNNVSLTNVSGTTNMGTGALSGASSTSFNVSGGTASITYSGSIANAASRSVSVTGKTGGTVTFAGAVSGSGSGIYLNSNTGSTLNFSGGNMSLNTGVNAAFTATGGGTVSITGSNNFLTTTTGIALNVASTTIGASGLTFRSISANGASSGVVLNNTGTSGGLTVTGDGSLANNFSGGTIQNAVSDSVSLTSANQVKLQSMRLLDPGSDGVDITGGSGITLSGVTIDLSGITGASESGHGGFRATNLGGINRIDHGSLITRVERQGSGNSGVIVINSNTNLTSLTLDSSSFTNSISNTNGEAFVVVSARGTSLMTLNVQQGSIFSGLYGSAIVVNAGETAGSTAAVSTSILTSTFQNAATNGVNNIELNALNGGAANFTVQGNTLNNIGKPLFASGAIKVAAADSGVLNGTIANNTLSNIGNSSTEGYRGIHVDSGNSSGGMQRVAVNNNNITATAREGLFVRAWNNTADMNLTIRDNIIGTAVGPVGTSDRDGLFVSAEDSAHMDVVIQSNSVVISSTLSAAQSADIQVGANQNATEAPVMNSTLLSNTFRNLAVNPDTFRSSTFNSSSTMCLDLQANNVISSTGVSGTGVYRLSNNSGDTFNLHNLANLGSVSQTGSFGSVGSCTLPAAPAAPTQALLERAGDSTFSPARNFTGAASSVIAGTANPPREMLTRSLSPAQLGDYPSGGPENQSPQRLTQAGPDGARVTTLVAVGPFALPAGRTVTITFDATITNPVSGGATQIGNQGQVSGSNFPTLLTDDPDTSAPNDITFTPLDIVADLSLSKSDGGVSVRPGGIITYTLAFTNAGPQHAASVILTETVPANTTFNSGASTAGWTCLPDSLAGSSCAFSVGTVLSASSGSANFAVTVASSLPPGISQISNTASMGSAASDPQSSNNTASDTTPVLDIPISGLVATNSSPTLVHGATMFTATISGGQNVNYQWGFGDGSGTASGAGVTHTYDVAGTFTAVVTATNSSGSAVATTQALINPYRVFLPLVLRNSN